MWCLFERLARDKREAKERLDTREIRERLEKDGAMADDLTYTRERAWGRERARERERERL